MRILFALTCFFFAGSLFSAGEWPTEKIENITENIREYRKSWTTEDTIALIGGEKSPNFLMHTQIGGNKSGGGTRYGNLTSDNGLILSLMITGNSILLDGKDLSGNLGSRITHGANSPIIENIRGSQVSTGEKSPIVKDASANISLNLSLSIALSISTILNLYLLRKLRKLIATDQQRNSRSEAPDGKVGGLPPV